MKKTQSQPSSTASSTLLTTDQLAAVDGGFFDFDDINVDIDTRKEVTRRDSGNTKIRDSNNSDVEEYWFIGSDMAGSVPLPSPSEKSPTKDQDA